MKLLQQPGHGVKPLVEAMDRAKEKIEIAIFRFDRNELEKAMIRAVGRGVFVHALIAYTNRGGEKNLRQLEMRLLEHGVNVARTADELLRYHGKYLIIDREELHVLGFNFTYLDMEHSRSFGLIIHDAKLVSEAVKLFEADTKRQAYSPGCDDFIVSPANAREKLSAFISEAKKNLLIYDTKIADPRMIRLIKDAAKRGVEVRVLGKIVANSGLPVRCLAGMRLHVRAMVRDEKQVFIGSQSLRTAELETRREVGVWIRDEKIAASIAKTFEEDWELAAEASEQKPISVAKAARRVAKAVAKSIPPIDSVLETVAPQIAHGEKPLGIDPFELEETVKQAVKQAVEQSVLAAVEDPGERAAE